MSVRKVVPLLITGLENINGRVYPIEIVRSVVDLFNATWVPVYGEICIPYEVV